MSAVRPDHPSQRYRHPRAGSIAGSASAAARASLSGGTGAGAREAGGAKGEVTCGAGGFASYWGLGGFTSGSGDFSNLDGCAVETVKTLFVENSGRILRLFGNFVGMRVKFFLGLATADIDACGAGSTARPPTCANAVRRERINVGRHLTVNPACCRRRG